MKMKIFRLSFVFLFFNYLKSDDFKCEDKNINFLSEREFNKETVYFENKESSKKEINNFLNKMVTDIIEKNTTIADFEKKQVSEYLINRLKNMIFSILNSSKNENLKLNKLNYLYSGFSFEKEEKNGKKSVIQFLIEKKLPVIKCYENILKNKTYDDVKKKYSYELLNPVNKDLMNPILGAFKDAGLDFSKILHAYPFLMVDLPVVFEKADGSFGDTETEKRIKNTNRKIVTKRGISKKYFSKELSCFIELAVK